MSDKIKDRTFMFTGTLSVTRDEARRIVEELEGVAASSLTKITDYLVCGEDQVGKSNKWEKAGLLGVTRVDEDFFWDLVKKARAEEAPEEVVHLSPEELETGNITDEHWEAIARINPNVQIMTGDQFERLLKVLLPSYESAEKLERLVKEYDLNLLPPVTCKFCRETIPYSTHTSSRKYYCFNCNQYQSRHEHEHVWFDPGVKQGYYMCNICGDFSKMRGRDLLYQRDAIKDDVYGNSVEYIADRREEAKHKTEVRLRVEKMLEGTHHCTDFEPVEELPSTERGFYAKCKVCGNVEFVDLVKLDETEENASEPSLT